MSTVRCGPLSVTTMFLVFALVSSEGDHISLSTYQKTGDSCRKPDQKSFKVRSQIECTVRCERAKTECTSFTYDKKSKMCTMIKGEGSCESTKTSNTVAMYSRPKDVRKHAFTVLNTVVTTYKGYEFLALKLSLPADGQSRSENWCRDYQLLCSEYSRRPTGCGPYHALRNGTSSYYWNRCVTLYNSDADIGEGGRNLGVLGCDPSGGVAAAANAAFGGNEAVDRNNAFGFNRCGSSYCYKDFVQSSSALSYARKAMQGNRIAFTLCR